MLFNSYKFILIFFPIVFLVARKIRGLGLIRWLTLSSIVFYSYAGHAWFVIPMLFTTTLDYFLAIKLENTSVPSRRKGILLISLCGNLGLLFVFKYSGLFAHAFGLSFWSLVLPAGISFYTFQTLSYMIDVYRKHCPAERSFWKFACFVSFFPHLVAGPLTRHNQLIPQLTSIEETGIQTKWKAGVFLFAVGLAKKILIADRIGNLIDPMLLDTHLLSFSTAWLSLIGYALQIYFDFSGYSDMAIGLGRLFGIELPQNFDSPYQATDPSDFWRRWHITLSRWLRDYLYISLGGNRCSPLRRNLNLMITMGLGGFGHGANWTFIAWGIYHGLLLVAYNSIQPWWDKLNLLFRKFAMFFLVCLGWVFFRAPNFTDAFVWFQKLFSFQGFALTQSDLMLLATLNGVGVIIAMTFKNAESFKDWESLGKLKEMGLGLATFGALLFMNYSSKFLYFQF